MREEAKGGETKRIVEGRRDENEKREGIKRKDENGMNGWCMYQDDRREKRAEDERLDWLRRDEKEVGERKEEGREENQKKTQNGTGNRL